jgi:hypothetical protein
MLFLGLGTGLGSALIAESVIVTLELGQLPHRKGRKLWEVLGREGLKLLGPSRWQREVRRAAVALREAFQADSVVLGGGNAKKVKDLPPGARMGHNLTAFRGGFRLWGLDGVPVQGATDGEPPKGAAAPAEWRVL